MCAPLGSVRRPRRSLPGYSVASDPRQRRRWRHCSGRAIASRRSSPTALAATSGSRSAASVRSRPTGAAAGRPRRRAPRRHARLTEPATACLRRYAPARRRWLSAAAARCPAGSLSPHHLTDRGVKTHHRASSSMSRSWPPVRRSASRRRHLLGAVAAVIGPSTVHSAGQFVRDVSSMLLVFGSDPLQLAGCRR